MAGGWSSITTDDGKFRSETFWNMIDNLGDAWESAEQCYGMVWYLAHQLAEIGDSTGEPSREVVLEIIAEAVQFHKDGRVIGGTEGE